MVTGTEGDDLLIGQDGGDWLQGGGGNDELRAGGGNDIVEGNAGRDRMLGGAGNDVYIYHLGDGVDRISDGGGGDMADRIVFGQGITPESIVLTASQHGEEVIVTFAGGNAGDVIILSGQLFAQQLGIDGFTFADGTCWSRAEILARMSFAPVSPITQNGAAADETILGGFGDDTLGGGGGTDLLNGGFGADSYHFNLGDGHDEIVDQGSILDVDTIVFGAGITPASVTLTRSLTDPSKLILSLNASDSVTISTAGNGWGDGIERIVFTDGTVRTITDLQRQYLGGTQTTGNDTVVGFDASETVDTVGGNDTLAGGKGDDLLKGAGGNESYRFNLGDGHDIISDTGGIDTLQFGAGIGPNDIHMALSNTDSDSLILTLPGARDGVTLHNQLNASYTVEQFTFADGTVWTSAQLLDRFKTMQQTDFDERIVGFASNDTLNGGAGDDRLYGGGGNDSLTGGAGNDTLIDDGQTNETYVYNPGNGDDLIIDDYGTDRVVLGAGISVSDVVLTRSIGDECDLRISFQNMAGSITVQDQFASGSKGIDEIAFSDGTVWNLTAIRAILTANAQTASNDRIMGFASNDTLSGGAGDDRIYGRDGDDSLTGGTGNDTLIDDGQTNETYVYNPGDGHDLVIDNAGTDRLVLGAGISASDVILTRSIGDENDLKITFQNAAGSITFQDQFYSSAKGIDEIAFSDGTVWTRLYIQTTAIANSLTTPLYGSTLADTIVGTALNDRIFANSGNDVIRGGAGNDYIEGYSGNDRYLFDLGDGQDVVYGFSGSDSLEFGAGIAPSDIIVERDPNNATYCILKIAGTADQVAIQAVAQVKFHDGTVWTEAQVHQRYVDQTVSDGRDFIDLSFANAGMIVNAGAGDDRIYANSGNDVIRGGAGNDYIEGYSGNDRYLFDLGDGQDVVYGFSGSDSLEFGAGIAPYDIIVERDPNNATYCILKIAGTADQVAIHAVAQVKFHDGTVWTEAQLHQRYVDQTVGADSDFIDTSFASAGMTVNPGAGDDRIYTEAGGDVIRGGTGNDYAESGAGNDRYLFDLGDGQDVFSGETGTDTVEFGAGIDPSDITVRRDETNTNYLVLQVAGTSDQLSIQGVETILFANGVSWTVSALAVEPLLSATGVVKLFGDSQDNQLIGTSGDDVFTGKAGNDVLIGSAGSDVFNFARGEGRDTIIDDGAASFTDALVLGAGILPSDILVQAIANHPNDLLLIIKGTEDAIYLADQLAGNGSGLEQVRFANGTVWTRTDIVATDLVSQSTSGNDTIYGSIFADTISGGLGADVLKGSFGSDSYQFNAGDGQDTIIDAGGLSGDNTLSFGSGLLTANLLVQRASPESADLVVRFSGSTDQVTVQSQFSGGGVATLAFHDGTTMDRAAIQSLVLQQATTTAADVINGFASDDTLTGGLGNDTLNGAAGGDTYVYASGHGSDLIDEALASGLDTLHFTNLNAADVSLAAAQDDANDLIVTIIATGETIRIDDQFATAASTNSGVDQFVFADSTTWNMASIAAATTFSFVGSAGNDTMNGGPYNDTIDGAAGDDAIHGNAGDDTLIGGLGNDTLAGGAGNDIFVFRPGAGLDTVSDFSAGSDAGDVIRLEGLGYESLSDVLAHAYQSGADTVIAFDASNKITLTGVTLTQLHENDFIFASA